MKHHHPFRRPLWWLVPMLTALPVIAAVAFVLIRYGTKLGELLNTLLKMVVIP